MDNDELDLGQLAEELVRDYVSGRWRPQDLEYQQAVLLSARVGVEGQPIEQPLSRYPEVASGRLGTVLAAYTGGSPQGQDLVHDLLYAIAGSTFPLLPPRSLRYVEAPAPYDDTSPSIFLGGGITGCPDWQLRAVLQLDAVGSPAVVLNPRRHHFPAHRPDAMREQVTWEYEHLRAADVILFWFCAQAVQPIALYELGAHAARGTRLAVGAHPGYPRRLDVLEQLRVARPDVTVRDCLTDTVRAAAALLPAAPTTAS